MPKRPKFVPTARGSALLILQHVPKGGVFVSSPVSTKTRLAGFLAAKMYQLPLILFVTCIAFQADDSVATIMIIAPASVEGFVRPTRPPSWITSQSSGRIVPSSR
jgi:hypothetical protein